MNTEKHIGLACFLGATIGALVALQLSHHFWWLGIIIGGLVGYLSYEFKTVISAVEQVWKSVPESQVVVRCFGNIIKALGALIITVIAYILVLTSVIIIAVGFAVPIGVIAEYVRGSSDPFSALFSAIPHQYFIIGTLYTIIMGCCFMFVEKRHHSKQTYNYGILIESILVSPIVMPVTICGAFIAAVVTLVVIVVEATPKFCSTIWKLAKQTFIKIHSELRLLCMTDAMIGAVIGYSCGNAIIGGIAGVLLGVVNYRIVSVRWLKLVPA